MDQSEALASLLTQERWAFGLARDLVRDPDRAEDLLQSVWVAALETPPKQGVPARPWLARALRNRMRHESRSRQNQLARAVEKARVQPTESAADHALGVLEQRQQLLTAVASLAEPYRSTVTARYYEDLPPREIARRIGKPVSTVDSRLSRGLAMLREHLDRQHGGDRERWVLGLAPILTGDGARATLGGSVAGSNGIVVAACVVMASVAIWAWLSASPAGHRKNADALQVAGSSSMDAVLARSVPDNADARISLSSDAAESSSVTITAVDGISLRSLAETEVRWWSLGQLGAEREDVERWLRQCELDEKVGLPTGSVVTDGAGVARVPRTSGGVLVTATSGDNWGYLVLPDSAPGQASIRLRRDGELSAFLADDAGRPVIGRPVALRRGRDFAENEDVLVAKSSAPDGRAIFPHARYMAPPSSSLTGATWVQDIYQLGPVTIGRSTTVRVTCDSFEQPPARLRVRASAQVLVRINDSSGRPIEEPIQALLIVDEQRDDPVLLRPRVFQDGTSGFPDRLRRCAERGRVSNATTIFHASSWRDVTNGTVVFDSVGLSDSVAILLRKKGDLVPRYSVHAGPRRPDDVVSLEVPWESTQATLRGRLVRPGGDPVARRVLRLGIRRDWGWLVELDLPTDETGGFSGTFDPYALTAGTGDCVVALTLLAPTGEPIAVARRYPAGLSMVSVVELGSIEIVDAPVIADGQVVDQVGKPLAGVLISAFSENGELHVMSSVESDEAGRFVLRRHSSSPPTEGGLPIYVHAELPGHHASLVVIDEGGSPVKVVMLPRGQVAGSLRVHPSIRPGDFRVGLTLEGEEGLDEGREAVIDDAWRFHVAGVVPGTYSLRMFAGSGEGGPTALPVGHVPSLTIAPGAIHRDPRLDPLHIPGLRAIEIKLRDELGAPIKRFSIFCESSRYSYGLQDWWDESGSVRLLCMDEPLSVSIWNVEGMSDVALDGTFADATIVMAPDPSLSFCVLAGQLQLLPPQSHLTVCVEGPMHNDSWGGHLRRDPDGRVVADEEAGGLFDASGLAVVRSGIRGNARARLSVWRDCDGELEQASLAGDVAIQIPETGDATFELPLDPEQLQRALDELCRPAELEIGSDGLDGDE